MEGPELHPSIPVLEYSHIDDNITIGTNVCCQTHFDDELKKMGISADISVEEERMDSADGVEYYAWIPVKDKTAPTMTQLKLGVRTITMLVEEGVKTYIHCKFGHGRSPTFVIAYFISQGMTFDEAYSKVAEQRPAIHLESAQRNVLKEFEESMVQ